jgi:hypothetical protein
MKATIFLKIFLFIKNILLKLFLTVFKFNKDYYYMPKMEYKITFIKEMIGDWGLGPNPQSPIPNPQSP